MTAFSFRNLVLVSGQFVRSRYDDQWGFSARVADMVDADLTP